MDLATEYLGLRLRNPLVAGASPLSRTADGVRRLADAGVAAVVLMSLFEEQLRDGDDDAARRYRRLLERSVSTVDVPVIASLNCATVGSWTDYARTLADAGAAALECNIYYLPADIDVDGRDVEDRYLDIVAAIRAAVDIPVSVKLGPYFSSMGQMARRLADVGADGLVLFNRFLQPDIDIEDMTRLLGPTLSSASEMRLPMTWIALLHGRTRLALAASTGVRGGDEVIKYLLAGADVVEVASALLRNGPDYAAVLLDGLTAWLNRKNHAGVAEIRGRLAVPDDGVAHERDGYVGGMRAADETPYGAW